LTVSLITLVADDTKPDLLIQLTDETSGLPLDVSNPTWTVYFQFRSKGSTTTLFTQTCTKVGDGSSGQVRMEWPTTGLAVDAGRYEGEVYVDMNGEIQTVYELINFKVREDFA